MGFVDDTCLKPEDPILAKQWERCDKLVISWLLRSCEKSISKSVLYCRTAADIWKNLRKRFCSNNGPKILQIERELGSLMQGNMNVTDYFTKLKSLWDTYDSMVKLPCCSCGGCSCDINGGIAQLIQYQRLVKFLMGLNDVYKTLRGNLLIMKSPPDVDTAYGMIIQDETQREFSDNVGISSEATAFAAMNRTQSNGGYARNTSYGSSANYNRPRFNQLSDTPRSNSSVGSYQSAMQHDHPRRFNNQRRPSYFCDYCKMSGHSNERCFKLHPELRNNNRPPPPTRKIAAQASYDASISDIASDTHTLTPDMYNQLVNLLSKHQNENSGIHTSPSTTLLAGPFDERNSTSW